MTTAELRTAGEDLAGKLAGRGDYEGAATVLSLLARVRDGAREAAANGAAAPAAPAGPPEHRHSYDETNTCACGRVRRPRAPKQVPIPGVNGGEGAPLP
jgi:hypothetical protein